MGGRMRIRDFGSLPKAERDIIRPTIKLPELHATKLTAKFRVRCYACTKGWFSTLEELSEHERKQHGVLDSSHGTLKAYAKVAGSKQAHWQCPDCSKAYSRFRALYAHIADEQNPGVQEDDGAEDDGAEDDREEDHPDAEDDDDENDD